MAVWASAGPPGSRAWSFPTCLGSLTPRCRRTARACRCPSCCLPHIKTRSAHQSGDFGAQYLACVYPCQTLRPPPCECRRMTRGQDGALLLSCAALSSATPYRFIPALSLITLSARWSTLGQDRQADLFSCLEIDSELGRHGLFHRKFRRFGSFEDFIHRIGSAPTSVGYKSTISDIHS